MEKLRVNRPEQIMLRFESNAEGSAIQSSGGAAEHGLDSAQWQAVKSNNLPLQQDERPGRPPPRPDDLTSPPGGQPPAPGACSLASFESQGGQWRAARFTASKGRGVVAVDLAATKAELQGAVTEALKIVVPLAVALTALGAWLLSALTMRPVNRLRDAMKGVTQNALDQRLPSQGEDREFRVLIDAYNTMLSRLETSFRQASRFSADAAHELKTPLTILQGRIEQALHKADQPAMQTELSELLDEVGRLSSITRKLLLLSQADAGWLALQRTSIDLSGMLDDIAADAHMMLTDQTLECDIDRQLSMQGDTVLMRQLLNNLVGNAVRYCRPGGWIKLRARALPGGIEVEFSNATQVIAMQDRARFFDRFYRGDASHNRHTDGTGLGLSLAREIARAHGGDLSLYASALDEVVLRLTLQAP
jgi:two-component system, OmpR family, heavy metal sensor histidine kinase CusS